jgi:hypothetical protein
MILRADDLTRFCNRETAFFLHGLKAFQPEVGLEIGDLTNVSAVPPSGTAWFVYIARRFFDPATAY